MQRLSLFILIIVSIMFFPLKSKGGKVVEPDFAFPKEVEAKAVAALNDADSAGPARLLSLLELVTARTLTEPDSLVAMPDEVAQQLDKPGLTKADRAMMLLLEAELYASVYNRNAWVYNKRSIPDYYMPEDAELWNGIQFKQRVIELADSALALAAAEDVPLQTYASALSYDKYSLQYFPNVQAFAELKKVDFLKIFGNIPGNDPSELTATLETALSHTAPATPEAFYWLGELYGADSKKILELYKQYSDVEAARYLLALLCDNNTVSASTDGSDPYAGRNEMIALLESSLKDFPAWYGNDRLRYALKQITRPVVSVSVPTACAPGVPFKVDIDSHFANGVELNFFSVPEGMTNKSVKEVFAKGSKTGSATVDDLSRDDSRRLSFTAPAPGCYAVVAILKGADADPVLSFIDCVPFVPVTVNGLPQSVVITADFTSGAPLAGVSVNSINYSSNRNVKAITKALGKSSAEGMLSYKAEENVASWSYLSFNYKGRKYDFGRNISTGRYWHNDAPQSGATIFSSRPLYRPGDTVEWAVVLAGNTADGCRVMADTEVTVVLFNANYVEVDTVSGRTDASGRFCGTFVLPQNQLTGRWSLRASWADNSMRSYIMVSDFKTPVIYTELTATERNVPAEGSVRLTGRVMTYSGMPVVGATVEATVKGAHRWRWFSPDVEIGRLTAVSDADGFYTIDVDSVMLAQALDQGRPFNNFQAGIVVTAPDASTAEVTADFTTGKPYVLAASMPKSNVDCSRPVAVQFWAYDASGKNVPVSMQWTLRRVDSDSVAACGTAVAGSTAELDLSALAADRYVLSLSPVDSALAEEETHALQLTAYNTVRNEVPDTGSVIFVPESSVESADGHAEVLIGLTRPHDVYTVVSDGDNLASAAHRRLERGFTRLPFDFNNKAVMNIIAVDSGRVTNVGVDAKRIEALPAIVAESFRDRVVPGSSEAWRIRLVDGDSQRAAADAAALVTIYNKALENLVAMSWPQSIYVPQKPYNSAEIGWYSVFIHTGRLMAKLMRQSMSSDMWPSFKYIHQYVDEVDGGVLYKTATSGNGIIIRGIQKSPLSASVTLNSAMLVDDMSEAEEALGEADYGAGELADAGSSSEAFEYRLSEVLQALWAPALTADEQGNIDICFTVPNANATWQLRATAWQPDLKSAGYAFECLANKPVMVQPNLPRYLRQGDRATILATVFNNDTEAAVVTTEVSLSTGVSRCVTDTIAAKASALVAVEVDVPLDAAQIEYTVKSSANGFADGERAIIPVLSSESMVIESTEFYLNPGDNKPFELSIKVPADAAVTLQYCQNPVWTVVKAMRGIAGTQPSTSNGLGIRLFSALAGRHIIGDNAGIAEVLRQWRENPSEQALTSMLSRNEDLKLLLLDQTPWAQASINGTARMEALAAVTDWQAPLEATVAALARLQNNDGGFAWGSWSQQSSQWSTETVLMHCALARSLGMLDSRDKKLTDMLAKAFAYLERQDLVREHPATTDLTLTLIAALMPELKPSPEGKLLIGRTVDAIALRWKQYDTVSKAYSVLVLKAHGRLDEARAVLESIRQFGVVRPDMGMCFPSVTDMRSYATILQAFAAMDAPRELIDAMRQWVIVQAQASDDIAALNPEYIIAAMLSTGTVWTSAPVSQCVTVDGKPLEIENAEAASGYFARRLPVGGGKMRISVTPNGVTPSYGSVVTVSRNKSSQVKARAGRDLSITKRVLAHRNDRWVETDEFVLGERLLVQLTVKAKRQLEYVSIDDCRPATFEPVEQLPVYKSESGLFFYRENLDANTRLFISYMPAGTYVLSYEVTANNGGTFTTGIATLQSQYAPELTAHSGGKVITVK